MLKNSTKPLTRGALITLLLMFFSFTASAVISDHVFERFPHLEDEIAYLYQARIFARFQAWVPRDTPVKYFWQPFLLQPEDSPDGIDKRFGKYTPGWPFVLTLGVWLGQTWMVNAILGALSVGLVYRLGREVFDEAVGVVAALLTAISPMALLLNATLMSHTWVMFAAILSYYAYWRTTKQGKGQFRWAVLVGLTFGAMFLTRPLTAIGVAAPMGLNLLSRLYDAFIDPKTDVEKKNAPRLSRMVVIMALSALPIIALWPIFNQIWTGDWRSNTYTMQWPVDKVGFGPGFGRNVGGHSLLWAFRNARSDLKEWMRDLYGFTMPKGMNDYLALNLIYGAGVGLSWLPVAYGLFVGRRKFWVWMFFLVFVTTVLASMTYWIGAVVSGAAAYSVRYYYESTFAVNLVAGYGIVTWARKLRANRKPLPSLAGFVGRLRLAWDQLWPGYFILLVAVGLSVVGYTPARFREPLPKEWVDGLWRYNEIGMGQLDAINAMRKDNPTEPVLIIVLQSPVKNVVDNWRDYGTAMALTSPFLDSDIIVVRVFEPENAPEMVRRFPGRLVLYQIGTGLYRSAEEAIAAQTG